MKNLEARLQRVEKLMVSNNQDPYFFFVEDPSQEDKPHYTACSELPGWAIFAYEGESINDFQARTKQEYKQSMKGSRNKLAHFVVLFGKNPE